MNRDQWLEFKERITERVDNHGKPPRMNARRLVKLCDYIADWRNKQTDSECKVYLLCRMSQYRRVFNEEMRHRLERPSVDRIYFGYPLTVAELYARSMPILLLIPTDDCGKKELDIIDTMTWGTNTTVVHEPEIRIGRN